jgi:uncharacterized protein YgbK (DUF1537 family)
MRMLILADDLSGAADCAIAAVDAGLSAVVHLRVGIATSAADAAEVVAVDLDSRSLPQAEARHVHMQAVRQTDGTGPELLLYKKFDSTLRGHVGAEIAACVEASRHRRLAIVAPAYPATGRTTRMGDVFIGGTSLEQTEVWMRSGMTGSANVLDMLREAGLDSAAVGLEQVRGQGLRLHDAIEAHAAAGAQALVCDAETDADLQCIAVVALALEAKPVLAGSAGLAQHVAGMLGEAGSGKRPEMVLPDRPTLIAVGSMSSVSREQARQIAEADPTLACFTVDPQTLLAGETAAAWTDIASALHRAVVARRDVLLTISLGDAVDVSNGMRLARALAHLAAPLLPSFGALVATGGETARSLLGALGVDRLRLAREVEPGVVLGFAEAPHSLAVVTKAGAFGVPGTLVNVWRQLRAARGIAML